jgi:hypothetical protein
MEYNLETFEGRLKALSDNLFLKLTTENGNCIFVNLLNLGSRISIVLNLKLHCTLDNPKRTSPKDFDDAASHLSLIDNVGVASLRTALFGPPKKDYTLTLPRGFSIKLEELESQAQKMVDGFRGHVAHDMGGKPC